MRLTLILLCSLFISACGDVWVKPGAGNDQLALDKAACKHGDGQAADESQFEQCMAAKGWWHPGADDESRASTAAPAPAAAPAQHTADNATPIGPDAGVSRAETVPAANASASPAASPAPAPASTSPQPDTPTPAPATPGQSWWKLGANDGDLLRDQAQCRKLSGVQFPAGTPYHWGESAAFDQCMREIGWRGN